MKGRHFNDISIHLINDFTRECRRERLFVSKGCLRVAWWEARGHPVLPGDELPFERYLETMVRLGYRISYKDSNIPDDLLPTIMAMEVTENL